MRKCFTEKDGRAAGSRYVTIPLTVESSTLDGKKQKFAREYVLRQSVVDGATAEQRTWYVYSANIKRKN